MSRSATLRDVAKACGCSVYTVSSVLNGKGRISQVLRNKVRQTARELNYDALKNMPLARRLTAPALAFVVPNLLAENDAFFWKAVSTARSLSALQNYDFKMFAEKDLATRLANDHASPVSLGFDRLIICCCDPPKAAVRQIMGKGIPVALIRREMDLPGIVIVKDDDVHGMKLAMQHLHHTHGHDRIGLIYEQVTGVSQTRQQSYLDYIRQNQLTYDPARSINLSDPSQSSPDYLVKLVKQKKLTALIAMSDGLSVNAAKHLLRNGLRIPHDISIVSYSNSSVVNSFYPEFTAINVPIAEMVTAACKTIFASVQSAAPVKTVIEFANTLVTRESCGPAPD